MSVTPYGLGSGVELIPGGARGYITERTEQLNGLPRYVVLTESEGRPRSEYVTHNELAQLDPGVFVGFELPSLTAPPPPPAPPPGEPGSLA